MCIKANYQNEYKENLIVWPHFPEMIILLYHYGYSLLHDFYLIISLNMMTDQKGQERQGIKVIEAFKYENLRSDFKCCHYCEK